MTAIQVGIQMRKSRRRQRFFQQRLEPRLVLAVKRLGLPCLVALNMADLAEKQGLRLDVDALSRELGVPVVRTVAVQGEGADALRGLLDQPDAWQRQTPPRDPQAGLPPEPAR